MNELMNSIGPRLEAARSELQRNPRLRWMLGGAVLVFLVYLQLLADDYREARDREYRPVHQQLSRLETIQANSAELNYGARFAAEMHTSNTLKSRFWQADTKGLAAADFQAWIKQTARRYELVNVRLELSELQRVEGMTEPLWRLDGELRAAAERSSLAEFLAALAGHEQRVTVDRLRYQPRSGGRINMLIVAYFRLEPTEEPQP